MRSKLTTIIMFFVTIAFLTAFTVLGMIIFNEVSSFLEVKEDDFEQQISSTNNSQYSSTDTTEENIKTPEIIKNDPLEDIQSTSTSSNSNSSVSSNIDYSGVRVNKYFYNQLEDASKEIYRAFEANKENMKSGTYQIEFGTSLSNILSQDGGSELLGKYYQSAIEAYTYDNPDVFYLSPNKMYLNIETITRGSNVSYNVFVNCGEHLNYLTDEFSSKEQIDYAIAQIEQVRDTLLQRKTGNQYQDIKMVHDYLVENIEYDTSLSKSNIYNIYGALVQKNCVCEGYARAFKYLMDNLGITCTMVIGQAVNSEGQTENHAWNYVQLNQKWNAIDVTWDDPVIIGSGTINDSYKYKYFLKGSSEFNKDRVEKGQFTEGGKVFTYPTLSISNYE